MRRRWASGIVLWSALIALGCKDERAPEGTRKSDVPATLGAFGLKLPTLPTRASLTRAEVGLPASAGRPFTLTDRVGGASVRAQLMDQRLPDVEAVRTNGAVVYSGREATVIHVGRPDGTEDHVLVRSGEPVVRYRIELEAGVVSLRVLGHVLELLDANGVPRLRVSAPFVADASGGRHPVELGVEECRFDSDPRPPWGRTIVAAGSRVCTLRFAWDGGAVGMPALLDPIWSLTGNMAAPRDSFGLVNLPNGKVLAACSDLSAELYDPTTGTWAATGSTAVAFNNCTATRLADGRVLLVALKNAAIYDPGTGAWTATGSLSVSRFAHAAVLLSNGKVLVAGGTQTTSPWVTASAELFDPSAGTWSATGNMVVGRRDLTLSNLPQAKVLAVAGMTADIYDEASGVWTAAAAPPSIHSDHPSAQLPGGKVMMIGGSYSKASSIFDPSTGTWTKGPSLTWERWDASAVELGNGQVLVTGGWDDTAGGEVEEAERYVPSLDKWIVTGSLQYLRLDHSSVLLPNGKAMVVGGRSVIIDDIYTAELLSLVADGDTCTGTGECASAYCVGGMCCNEPCTALCRSCRAAEKAGGADGACGFAKAGLDPAGQCPDQGAGSCGSNGTCDGAGACAKYALGTVCSPPSCQSGVLTTSTCAAGPLCQQTSQSCAPYGCADGLSCGTSCTLDEQCQAPATCDVVAGKCVPPQQNGAPCGGPKQCVLGHCVDGVCCESACTGLCKACSAQKKGGGADGVCGNIAAGLDPDGDCPTDSAESCQRDGSCSGTGSCRLYAAGAPCGPTACIGGLQSGSSCDGAGTCAANATVDCGAYACIGSSCNLSCGTSNDCAAKAWCDLGKCLPRLADGAACTSEDQCQSGFCADGVCCSAPCGGQCEACDTWGALGICVRIQGKPHGQRPPCPVATSAGPCTARRCDGLERQSCNGLVGSEVECRAGICENDVATVAAQCDGLGNCPPAQTAACSPFACGDKVCKSSCSADGDCASGATCGVATGQCVSGAICSGPTTLRDAEGKTKECTPYACSVSACRTSCGSIQDCAPGNICSNAGTCTPPPAAVSGDDGGCSAAKTRSGRPLSWALVFLVLAFAKRARRRARARS